MEYLAQHVLDRRSSLAQARNDNTDLRARRVPQMLARPTRRATNLLVLVLCRDLAYMLLLHRPIELELRDIGKVLYADICSTERLNKFDLLRCEVVKAVRHERPPHLPYRSRHPRTLIYCDLFGN